MSCPIVHYWVATSTVCSHQECIPAKFLVGSFSAFLFVRQAHSCIPCVSACVSLLALDFFSLCSACLHCGVIYCIKFSMLFFTVKMRFS